jgi:predicted nucleotidyltransferase component of viral defense system
MKVSEAVEETFGYAEMHGVAFEDLFAGKIVAALDQQHPRDLFDIRESGRSDQWHIDRCRDVLGRAAVVTVLCQGLAWILQ